MAQTMAAGRSGTAMSMTERSLCIGGGALLTIFGLRRGGWLGMTLALAGGGLLLGAATGQPLLRRVTGGRIIEPRTVEAIGTAARRLLPAAAGRAQPAEVVHSVTIGRPREELYRFWRDFSNLPRVMDHLERVDVRDGKRSHWVAKAPGGGTVEWDAEVTGERENESIAWRSVEPAEIPNEGEVRFRDAPAGRGTEVTATLRYRPPGGQLGRGIAKLFGEEPEQQVHDALRRFKQIMETGEVPTTAGQPAGRR